MKLINQNSLAETLNNYYDAVYTGKAITAAEKKGLAKWLASRQGLARSYAGMVTPTEKDYNNGVKLFTGELIDMKASIGHILGEESLRALHLLNVKDNSVQQALKAAKNGINNAIDQNIKLGNYPVGWYCCGKCSASYWRNLSAEGIVKNKSILNAGLKILNKMRDGKGKWNRFPFYYTVMSLAGIDLPAAKAELAYAEKGILRMARNSTRDKFAERRRIIAKLALEKI